MAATLNISSVELVSTTRTAPENGAPSSQDYNDTMRELLTDLSALADTVNQNVLPLLNSLPASSPLKLDGDGIFASHDLTNSLFVDSTSNTPLTLSSVLIRLAAITQAQQATIRDLNAQVMQLSTRLATTNQVDVSLAIQGFNDTLLALVNRVATLESKATS